jgi:hypothetical protein
VTAFSSRSSYILLNFKPSIFMVPDVSSRDIFNSDVIFVFKMPRLFIDVAVYCFL